MDMATTTTTTTTDGLLALLWLASPALPVGGFSYSEGLEAAVDEQLVTNEAQASEWLAARAEWKGDPPESVRNWLADRGVDI